MKIINFYSLWFILALSIISHSQTKFLNDLYHTSQELYDKLDYLTYISCKSLMTKDNLASDQGVNSLSYYTLRSPSNSFSRSNKKKVVMIFGEHPRELITTEQALFFIQVLCKNEKKFDDETVDAILSKFEFVIVPIVNQYGRAKVEEGDFCWRLNENGVDINRNWDSHWEGSPIHDVQYPGDSPFSEWETRALHKLMNIIDPFVFITTHSGNLGMYTPFAYKKWDFSDLKTDDRDKITSMLGIVKKINRKYCNCTAGSIGNELGYLCHGTCLDYAFEQLRVKFTFGFEIYDGKTTNPQYLEVLDDPDLKAFNYKEFLIENASIGHNFIQTKLRTGFLKNPSKYEKLIYYVEKDKDLHSSCFTQLNLKQFEANEKCEKIFNPLSELHFKNTLLNWTNVYLELFTIISLIEK